MEHSAGGSAIYLPISIIVSVLILSATIFIVSSDLSKQVSGLSAAVGKINVSAPAGNTGGAAIAAPEQQAPQEPIDMAKLVDDDPVEGSADAPVTIVEFSDFQCPFCEKFYSDTLGQVRKDYIDTGKVKLVYRDFPLSFHPEAEKAAEAAECADDQGKFWEMHDKIFENQETMGVASYKQWAPTLGLNSATFNKCLDSGEKAAEVQADFSAGQSAGVSGTPTFFINGTAVVGAQPYSVFKQAIDAALAG